MLTMPIEESESYQNHPKSPEKYYYCNCYNLNQEEISYQNHSLLLRLTQSQSQPVAPPPTTLINNNSTNCTITRKSTKSSSSNNNKTIFLVSTLFIMILTQGLMAVDAKPAVRRSAAISNFSNSNNAILHTTAKLPSISQQNSQQQQSTLQNMHGLDTGGTSLSIVSPLDILRQNLVKEILRRKQRKSTQEQLKINREILDRIG